MCDLVWVTYLLCASISSSVKWSHGDDVARSTHGCYKDDHEISESGAHVRGVRRALLLRAEYFSVLRCLRTEPVLVIRLCLAFPASLSGPMSVFPC